MSIRVLVREHPHRTVALVAEDHVMLFKHAHSSTSGPGPNASSTSLVLPNAAGRAEKPRCMAEFTQKSSCDLQNYRTLTTARGTLGLITLNNDVFICVVTGSHEVAEVRPQETVQRIIAVEFYCLNRSDYDHGHSFEPNPYPGQTFSSDDVNYGGGYDQSDSTAEHPFHALKKLLNGGNFYYSSNFDLTRRLQDRVGENDTVDISSLDEGLLWNSYMINPLLSFRSRLSGNEREALDKSGMLTSVIRGFAQTLTIPPSSSPIRRKVSNYPARLTVISRLSARRAGTRFNSRGLDDHGNVANFVETETVFWSPTGLCFSYVQIRGSVPIFWESTSSLVPGQQKMQITRSVEATQPSFDKHFAKLEKLYGAVHIVNLLSESKPVEVELSDRYRQHISNSVLVKGGRNDFESHELLKSTEFDFHERTRLAGGYEGAQELRPYIDSSAESFAYFLSEDTGEFGSEIGSVQQRTQSVVIMEQAGIFRVNCLDCLDRTNLVQGILSQLALELFLDHRSERGNSNFWLRHSSLWADNGDALSKIYAGTGALKSSFTRHGKMSLGGLISDARKSATRLYVNRFEDKGRQNTVDLLLGRLVGQGEVELFDPVNDWVLAELSKRRDDFETSETVRVWVGSYNLNGRVMSDIDELRRWLPNTSPQAREIFEVIVVGFQEIVELSPQQIMSTDPRTRLVWESAVKQCLNGIDTNEKLGDDGYVLLRSGQLVGAALMIFVRSSALARVKNVEGAIKKTGMSGVAGNKGAVAIRMDIEGTSLCFVTAHLAAGFGNYEERNRDYNTISSGLRFQRDRSIDDHDVVVWAGDFNYRIGLSYERARHLVALAAKNITYGSEKGHAVLSPEAEEILGQLYENDQLNIQMVVGHVFQFYREAKVKFLPTYKFDLGRDEYDSSEKARIPAWTDRILWRTKPGSVVVKQLQYASAMDVRFSDHRPIFSTFAIDVKKINKKKKAELSQKLYEKRSRDMRRVMESIDNGDDGLSASAESDEADDLMGYQSIQEGLPPASSDKRKWWLDGERAVRSEIRAPREGLMLNERRSGNPWREGGEDEWIEADRSVAIMSNGGNEGNKPQPPPPRRGQKKSSTPSNLDGPTTQQEPITRIASSSYASLPPALASTSRNGSFEGLSRSASIASNATTATMMTARSSTGAKKTPPAIPSKPVLLASGMSSPRASSLSSNVVSERRPTSVAESHPHDLNNGTNSQPQIVSGAPPPLPRRSNTSSSVSSSITPSRTSANVSTSTDVDRKVPPPVQPRIVTRLQQRGQRPREQSTSSISSISSMHSTLSTSSAKSSVEATEAVSRPTLPPRPVASMLDSDGDDNNEVKGWKPLTPSR